MFYTSNLFPRLHAGNYYRIISAAALCLLAAATRLLPHQANVTAVGAVALVAGCYLGWRVAAAVTVAAMLASDAVIGFYHWPVMASVYGSLALAGGVGAWVRRPDQFSWVRAAGGSFLGSAIFYLATNWAVWQFTPLYPKTAVGLWSSYLAALPFFRNGLLGDLLYGAVLFGLAQSFQTRRGLRYGLRHAMSYRYVV